MNKKWVFIVEGEETATDPVEVVYRLVQIDDKGNIHDKDGYITECEHGVWKRMHEALENGVYQKQMVKPKTEAIFKVIKDMTGYA